MNAATQTSTNDAPTATRGPRIRLAQFAVDRLRSMEKRSSFSQKVMTPFRICCEALVIGLLTSAEMDAVVQATYQSQPTFYDPTRYKLSHETRMLPGLKNLASPPCDLLDAFCGQGREAEIFADAGYKVTAIDRESWMIESAKKYSGDAGFDTDFQVANFATYNPGHRFAIVYTSLWMLSTFQGAERRQAMLAKCRELCLSDGIVVVSIVSAKNDRPWGRATRFALARIVAGVSRSGAGPEIGQRFYSGLFWHHLGEDVVQKDIESVGLEIVDSIEAEGLAPAFYFLACKSLGKDDADA